MLNVRLNTEKVIKKMKPIHGGGQPPIGGKGMTEFFHYMTEAGIPYSRLHDVGGPFGGNRYVDIPNIFRDFDADENDPANYDFYFTDEYIGAIQKTGCEAYYRLGITIEWGSKKYFTAPPKDAAKWARICEHVIRHYNEGWANGFHHNIQYIYIGSKVCIVRDVDIEEL